MPPWSQLNEKKTRLDALRPLQESSIRSLMEALDVELVYSSNAVEGNTLTLQETSAVLLHGVTVAGKPLKDHLEAVHLASAWKHVKELAQVSAPLSENELLELHTLVLGKDDPAAGHYRSVPVFIRGSKHVPPNARIVPEKMEQLFAMDRTRTVISTALQSAVHKAFVDLAARIEAESLVPMTKHRAVDFFTLRGAKAGKFFDHLTRWLVGIPIREKAVFVVQGSGFGLANLFVTDRGEISAAAAGATSAATDRLWWTRRRLLVADGDNLAAGSLNLRAPSLRPRRIPANADQLPALAIGLPGNHDRLHRPSVHQRGKGVLIKTRNPRENQRIGDAKRAREG